MEEAMTVADDTTLARYNDSVFSSSMFFSSAAAAVCSWGL
jgi:hypothetical protein